MKTYGKNSIISILRKVISISFFGVLAAGVIMGIIIILSLFIPDLRFNTFQFDTLLFSLSIPINNITQYQTIVLILILVVASSFCLFILHQLRQIFKSLVVKGFFEAGIYKRIRLISLAILAGSIIVRITGTVFATQILHDSIPGLKINVNLLPWDYFFISALVFVLSEVFRIGEQIKTENDLTV